MLRAHDKAPTKSWGYAFRRTCYFCSVAFLDSSFGFSVATCVLGPCPFPPPFVIESPFVKEPVKVSANFPIWEISELGKCYSRPFCSARTCWPAMKKSRYTKSYENVIRVLRDVRREAGLTQSEVGKQFGGHASFVSKCESGERRIDVVELSEFCRLYGITLAAFLDRAQLA